ncbi:MAG TPA: TolC family protein [Nannocystaceae bacterium]|nr:TolC family protein [Nannocystaceae bacterium]
MTPPDAPQTSLARRIAGFIAVVALGIAGFVWLQASKPTPRKRPAEEMGRPVRVIEVSAREVVPRIVGYGAVEAKRSWQALAEVGGVVVHVDERLEVGRIVQEGTVLLRIDPAGYEIEQNRSEASAKAVRAQIAELRAREKSAETNLKIERRSLELARKDLERVRKLYEEGNAPLVEVETAERTILTAEKAVQGYVNTLAELPASRRVLEAQLEQQEAGVATTRKDLAKTEIVAPFTMRLREVNVELEQVVTAGAVLVVGDGIDAFEIPAQIPVGSLGALRPDRPLPPADAKAPADGAPAPSRRAPIDAIVRLESQGVTRTWTGRFDRFGGIDPATRTMLAVVEVTVDDENRGRQRGSRLNTGLFVEVELRGPPRTDCLAIPRTAYHDGKVYVVGAEERLELRAVETTLVQEELVCVTGEIAAGDRVVVSELVPAIAGTLLAPRVDDEAIAALDRNAAAEGDAS